MLQQRDVCVQTLISDHGGNYTSKEFRDYLALKGTRHKLTVHDTPEQNGIAKQVNWTLVEKTRAMLLESNLQKSYIECQLVEYVWNPSPVGAVVVELWLISCIWHFLGVLHKQKSATINWGCGNALSNSAFSIYPPGMLISCIIIIYQTVHSPSIPQSIWLFRVLQRVFIFAFKHNYIKNWTHRRNLLDKMPFKMVYGKTRNLHNAYEWEKDVYIKN